jgi:hypothetical protein
MACPSPQVGVDMADSGAMRCMEEVVEVVEAAAAVVMIGVSFVFSFVRQCLTN